MKKLGKIISRLILLILSLITIIYIILIAGFMFIVPAINDFKASRLEKQLTSIELPKQTEFVDSGYIIGRFGNGNGTDYFIAMVIKSELPKEKLKKYYKDYEVAEQKSADVDEDLLLTCNMTFSKLSQVKSFENYYLVYRYDGPDPDGLLYGWDIRGH